MYTGEHVQTSHKSQGSYETGRISGVHLKNDHGKQPDLCSQHVRAYRLRTVTVSCGQCSRAVPRKKMLRKHKTKYCKRTATAMHIVINQDDARLGVLVASCAAHKSAALFKTASSGCRERGGRRYFFERRTQWRASCRSQPIDSLSAGAPVLQASCIAMQHDCIEKMSDVYTERNGVNLRNEGRCR